MLSSLNRLLGDDAAVLRRYAILAVAYGILCGLSAATPVPVVMRLMAGDLPGAGAWMAVLLTGLILCWWWRGQVERAGVRVGVAVLQAGRHRLGDHVARLPVGWFTPHNTARLGHVVTQGLMAVAQLPAHVFTPVVASLVTPIVMILALCAIDWSLGLLALAGLALLGYVHVVTGRLSQRSGAAFQRDFAAASARIVEFAQAQPVLRAFGGARAGMAMLEQAIEEQRRSGLRLIWRSAMSAVLNAWAVQAVFALLLAALAWRLAGGMDPVAAVAVLLLLARHVEALMEVVNYGEVLRGAHGQLAAVDALFEAPPLQEPAAPQAPRDSSVELHDVRFGYASDSPDVLRGVNLRIAPGSMTALIGHSGSGKTTLARLVARFFDVQAGSVLVGGVDVRAIGSEQLGEHISQIFQDHFLFSGTIADNIRIGKPGAGDAEVMEAARQAGLGSTIAALPHGLDTPTGEGGALLSGGERQRVAIARALIKDAPILLVDEATSKLDADNQALVAATLARQRGRRTILVIAHQLSTVAMADRIVVLEDGQVVEQGAPAELLARDGRYARFLARRRAAQGWRIAGATDQGAGS